MIFSKRTYLFILGIIPVILLLTVFDKPKVIGFRLLNANTDSVFWTNTDSAITKGLIIPDIKQVKEGKLVFKFTSINLTGQDLYYKLFYLNTSYGFNEDDFDKSNDLLLENFYGSWNDFGGGFKPMGSKIINTIYDSIQIVGNPLDESKYFGA